MSEKKSISVSRRTAKLSSMQHLAAFARPGDSVDRDPAAIHYNLSLTPMRVFLTGATGYVGSAVLDAFVRAGHQVTALVRHSGTSPDAPSRPGVDPVVGDLSNPASYVAAAALCDTLVHTGVRVVGAQRVRGPGRGGSPHGHRRAGDGRRPPGRRHLHVVGERARHRGHRGGRGRHAPPAGARLVAAGARGGGARECPAHRVPGPWSSGPASSTAAPRAPWATCCRPRPTD